MKLIKYNIIVNFGQPVQIDVYLCMWYLSGNYSKLFETDNIIICTDMEITKLDYYLTIIYIEFTVGRYYEINAKSIVYRIICLNKY